MQGFKGGSREETEWSQCVQSEKENVTESLKATDQMVWVQKMNNIRNRATEIVNAEMIYTV